MREELQMLYQEVILDHNRSPRNFGECQHANRMADGHNPLCGDKIKVFIRINSQNCIEAISFTGEGCAISTASASLMTEAVKGKTIAEAVEIQHQFQRLVTQENATFPELDKLTILAGVKAFPMRVKCATLPWHTLKAALNRQTTEVCTE